MSKNQQEPEHPIDALIESITAQCKTTKKQFEVLGLQAKMDGCVLTVEDAKVMEALSAVNVAALNMVQRLTDLKFIGTEEAEPDDEDEDEEEEDEEEDD